MDVFGYLRMLRRRWRLIVALIVLGVGAAAVTVNVATPVYEAQTKSFVALRDGAAQNQASNAYQGGLFAQDRMKSYAEVVTQPVVLQPVVDKLRLTVTPDRLASRVQARSQTGTVLIEISVRDPSPERARDVANAVSTQFSQVVATLESPEDGVTSPVRVTIVRQAGLPTQPVSPRPGLTIAVGLLVGLAFGLGVAVLREFLDTSVKTSEDLQRLTTTANLGEIHFDAEAMASPLVPLPPVRSNRGEEFRALRTNLRFIDVDRPPRAVVVTSAVGAEGKSTTACNLAITLALAGLRVALVEGDLRRPRVADYMGLEGSAGLTDVLIGRSQLQDVLQPWGDTALAVLPSGPLPPSPSELLGSRQMTDVLAHLRELTDFVVVDAPPLLPVTDAAILAHACDGAIMVVRHGRTSGEQVRRGLQALSSVGARILGTVLTMTPTKGPDGYGYYHSMYYEQGGRHSDSDRDQASQPAAFSGTAAR
jgi:capsular exopolysaccharide synthesis family protein